MSLRVRVTRRAQKELARLPVNRRYRLLRGLKRLKQDPTPNGRTIKRISQDPKGTLRRLRIGEYRVFFEVEGKEVMVLRCVSRQAFETAIRQLLHR